MRVTLPAMLIAAVMASTAALYPAHAGEGTARRYELAVKGMT